MDNEAANTAKVLNRAQKKLIMAASEMTGKTYETLCRHAKISPLHGTAMHYPMWELLESDPPFAGWGKFTLTDAGARVRTYLEQKQ